MTSTTGSGCAESGLQDQSFGTLGGMSRIEAEAGAADMPVKVRAAVAAAASSSLTLARRRMRGFLPHEESRTVFGNTDR
ncbi:hypothetical protein GCM10020221_31120 [Streptomyces thioluteus]|uniref:Uncharacterized protein n=1 Tax=Streptomyces thioluteus TaxID=66431 RepID=A0ABN3X2T6_STRTU